PKVGQLSGSISLSRTIGYNIRLLWLPRMGPRSCTTKLIGGCGFRSLPSGRRQPDPLVRRDAEKPDSAEFILGHAEGVTRGPIRATMAARGGSPDAPLCGLRCRQGALASPSRQALQP